MTPTGPQAGAAGPQAGGMDLDETAASHTGMTRLGRVLGLEGGDDATPDAIPKRRRAAEASEFCCCQGGTKDKACCSGKCSCWEEGWAFSPQHCGCRCCVNTGRLDCVVEGLPRVPASDSWLLVHRLFSSLVASVNLINVTSGKPDGAFLGHCRTPSRPASSGETPQAGQDCHYHVMMDAPVAPVVLCALL